MHPEFPPHLGSHGRNSPGVEVDHGGVDGPVVGSGGLLVSQLGPQRRQPVAAPVNCVHLKNIKSLEVLFSRSQFFGRFRSRNTGLQTLVPWRPDHTLDLATKSKCAAVLIAATHRPNLRAANKTRITATLRKQQRSCRLFPINGPNRKP